MTTGRIGVGLVALVATLGVVLFGVCPVSATELDKKLEKRFHRAMAAGDAQEVGRIFDEFGRSPDGEAAGLMLTAMASIPNDELYQRGLKILGKFGSATVGPTFDDLLTGKTHPLVLAALMGVAIEIADPVAEGWVQAGLRHESDLVNRNAIDAAVALKSKVAIPDLIALMEREGIDEGIVAYNARRALIRLTGHDFDSVDDWKNFWAANQESVDPKNLDGETSGTGVAKKRIDTPDFFGVEIISRRVIFIIDMSGSMTMYDERREEGGSGGNWENRVRMRRTKVETLKAIKGLAKEARFNVIGFSNRVETFNKKGMVPASSGAKNKAAKWVNDLVADGATHTDEAIELAFKDPQVDTIILLTDGAPMKSQNEQADQLIPQILRDTARLNRLRKVRIFTFGFEGDGEWPPGSKYAGNPNRGDPRQMVEFLKKLAADHGGTYTPIP